MAWNPISGTVPQYHVNGAPATDYYLKGYAVGGTTPLSMATDSTGGTTLAKCKINSAGYPVNGSNAVFIPHFNANYKLALYTNATDADANTTANATWVVDAIPQTDSGLRAALAAATGALLVWWQRVATGAVNRAISTILTDLEVTPQDFGAVGDGSTNDQAAFAAAIAHIKLQQKTIAAMTTMYSTPVLKLPEGYKYLVTGNFSLGTDFRIKSNRAIITDKAAYPFLQTAPLFTNVGPGCVLDGLCTTGFTNIVEVVTANADASMIQVINGDFQEWSGTCITVDSNSPSTLLIIDKNRFESRGNSPVVLKNWCDMCIFSNNWVQGPNDLVIWNKDIIHISNMLGVGNGTPSATATWVLNEGTICTISASRTGDSGTKTLVTHNVGNGGTNATKLSVRNSEIYCGSYPIIIFKDIPDVFDFEDINGLVGSYPFKFDSTIPAASIRLIGSRNTWNVGKFQQTGSMYGQRNASGESTVAALKCELVQNLRANLSTVNVLESQKVFDILYNEASYTPVGSLGAGMTSGAGTDFYGAATQTITGVDGGSNFNTAWSTIMSGKAAGVYTMLVNVEVVTDNIVQFNAIAGNQIRTENLGRGCHTISVPFYFDGTNEQSCGYSFVNLCASATISHGGLRIFTGRLDGYKHWNSITYADAAPAAGYHRLGDKVLRLTYTSGSWAEQYCTEAGTPGTWKAGANIA